MKMNTKRLLSVLLCLAMVLAILPMAVFAADTKTIYLNAGGSSLWDQADAWFAAWVWGSADGDQWVIGTDNNSDGTYEFAVPSDATGMKFLRMSSAATEPSWIQGDSGYWNATGDLTIPTDGKNCYTIAGWGEADGAWVTLGGTVESYDYYVAGDAGLCGVTWNASALANGMTKNASGLYEKVYTNVAAGTYSFKVTDGTWDNSWGENGGSSNYTLTVSSACDVTITFNADTKEITVSGTGVGEYVFDVQSVTAVGAGEGNFLNGVVWNEASSVNHMTEESEGVWSITYMRVAAGEYEFKFAANDAYTENWGAGGAVEAGVATPVWHDGQNCVITIDKLSNVTLTLDLSAYDPSTKQGATCTVTVEEVPVSTAPAALVDGDNSFEIANGDNGVVSSTYTATKAGVLVINPTAMSTYDAYAEAWGDVPAAFIPMQFGMQYALVVNGETQYSLPATVEVKAGDTVTIGVQSGMGNAAKITLNLAVENYDIKWQVTGGTDADSASTSLRLITYVDSLDYSSVKFSVTVNGTTKEYQCTTAYSVILAGGKRIENPDVVFGDDSAKYFITYSLNGIPNSAFETPIVVTVTWTDLDGNETESYARTILISDFYA